MKGPAELFRERAESGTPRGALQVWQSASADAATAARPGYPLLVGAAIVLAVFAAVLVLRGAGERGAEIGPLEDGPIPRLLGSGALQLERTDFEVTSFGALEELRGIQHTDVGIATANQLALCMQSRGFDYIPHLVAAYPDLSSSQTPRVDEIEFRLTYEQAVDPNQAVVAQLPVQERQAWADAFGGQEGHIFIDGEITISIPETLTCELDAALAVIGLDERNSLMLARQSVASLSVLVDDDPSVRAAEAQSSQCIREAGVDRNGWLRSIDRARSVPVEGEEFLANIDFHRSEERRIVGVIRGCSVELDALREQVAQSLFESELDFENVEILGSLYGKYLHE